MTIDKVSAFKTTDGVIHENRSSAIMHEFKIEISGLLNKSNKFNSLSFAPSDVARILVENSKEVTKIISKFNTAMNRAAGQQKKKENKSSSFI